MPNFSFKGGTQFWGYSNFRRVTLLSSYFYHFHAVLKILGKTILVRGGVGVVVVVAKT